MKNNKLNKSSIHKIFCINHVRYLREVRASIWYRIQGEISSDALVIVNDGKIVRNYMMKDFHDEIY